MKFLIKNCSENDLIYNKKLDCQIHPLFKEWIQHFGARLYNYKLNSYIKHKFEINIDHRSEKQLSETQQLQTVVIIMSSRVFLQMLRCNKLENSIFC